MAQKDLSGKVVVITGASSGFGKGLARRLAKEGCSLVLAARRKNLLEELAQECRTLGVRALALETDVSDLGAVANLASVALAEFGQIDVWVNNAGVGAIGRFEDIPLEEQAKVIETNLLGTLYGSSHAYRQFQKQASGILINIASELGRESVPYYAAYTASKHGVVGLCDALRQEVRQAGLEDIHVCAIMPTAHDTPFFDHVANYSGHQVEPPTPLHDPENVVEAIVAAARDPGDENIVGWDGTIKIAMKRLLPSAADAAMAWTMYKTQMDGPPASNTSGAVNSPIEEGTEVDVGRRTRR
ncbi:SDR family NAD(P)-dependent oxidoreductase [Sinorhizobium meliloti]|uniref:SDR family oxidoreductase n=1 Tax=Rhizobium meliloti TaxID=382 RepID=UPI001295074D|nr:SDR family oxidoreductase [Sinorhizobium meliloti]MQW55043.1 SDR family NAD(P)-dependent oxidoreductase [Sinorhizobium meliloti]MQW63932.1 SDR family NAD(P)-dependent oxidoreductase [Sinorhizobium meliloti]